MGGKIQDCYCCDAKVTSPEHVPPKCLFPKANGGAGSYLQESLITVPSCDLHNSKNRKMTNTYRRADGVHRGLIERRARFAAIPPVDLVEGLRHANKAFLQQFGVVADGEEFQYEDGPAELAPSQQLGKGERHDGDAMAGRRS